MFNFTLNHINKIPKLLLSLIIITCFYGFFILFSAGHNHLEPWAIKQMINFVIFFPVMILVSLLDLKFIYKYSYVFYLVVLLLLVGVELFGHSAKGAARWLSIGPIRIQPSELSKIAIVLFLAKYFHGLKAENSSKIIYLIPAIFGIIIPAALIIKQPDLGTGLVVLIVSAIILFSAGLKRWIFIAGIIGALIISPLIWMKLHNYQKKRVEVFLNPELDPLGSGYNIIQSKIAIGSGGFFGNGLGQGSQSHLSFLPEHQTDFIFACLCEDLGFVGAFSLIILYGLIICLCLAISINTKSIFSKLLVIGVTSIFFCHAAINIGMVSGLLPVVGIPLPLISYGGTMMGSILIGFGIIMNVQINSHSKI